MTRFLRAALLLFAFAPAANAQQKTITATDMWKLQRVGGPVASPDGNRAVFVVTTYDIDENKGNADLYLLSAAGAPMWLTFSPANDNGPAWSPDSRRIAFVSGRAGDRPQMFVIDANGGEGAGRCASPGSAHPTMYAPVRAAAHR